MDELSPLFQEIEFHERYRGYDPDEVDAFVDRVARAAAVMRGRLTELHERVAAAEARGGGAAHSDAEETLTRTLVLAQRTADAAIAEAREEADRVTADAATSAQAILSAAEAEAQLTRREAQAEATTTIEAATERASLLLAEAETDRRTLVAEAESQASEAARTERERLATEVAELHEYRAFLADDIEILERHLTEQRHQLTVALSALTDLLESPEAFRASRPPATSGIDLDPDLLAALTDPEPEPEAEAATGSLDVTPEPEPAIEPEPASEAEPEPVAEPAATSDEADAAEPVGQPEPEPALVDVATTDDVAAPIPDAPAAAVVDDDTFGDDETIDLVAAESAAPVEEVVDDDVVFTEIDLGAGEEDADADARAEADVEVPAHSQPAYAGVGERMLDAPRVRPGPPRLVTAADLESSDSGGPSSTGRLGFETSTVDRSFDDGGPATEAVPALQDGSLFAEPEVADDPFLSQLRDAMDNEAVPEADDDALSAFFDQEEDDGGRSWFGRRR